MQTQSAMQNEKEMPEIKSVVSAKAVAVKAAIEKLETLSLGTVEKYDSYDALEAGCLSCSGVKAEDK